MRKLAIPLTAALAIAAAAVPAAAGAHTDPGQAPSEAVARSDTALRPTAIEYGLIAALAGQQPVTEPVTRPGVLDPAFDPGFGGGSLDPIPSGGPALNGISVQGID